MVINSEPSKESLAELLEKEERIRQISKFSQLTKGYETHLDIEMSLLRKKINQLV